MPDERTERTGSASAIAARYALALTAAQLVTTAEVTPVVISLVPHRENGGHD